MKRLIKRALWMIWFAVALVFVCIWFLYRKALCAILEVWIFIIDISERLAFFLKVKVRR